MRILIKQYYQFVQILIENLVNLLIHQLKYIYLKQNNKYLPHGI